MKTLNSQYEFQHKDSSRRLKALAMVVVLHVFLGWTLMSGMVRKSINLVNKPLEAVVIQEVIIPPPPPPPPPSPSPEEIVKPKVTHKVETTPPIYVPHAEVVTAKTETATVIEATNVLPSEPAVIAPPPAAPSEPVIQVESVTQVEPKRANIGVVCPVQVEPEMPRKAAKNGITGVVKARIHIKNGVVQRLDIISGPGVFHEAVKKAVMQYECTKGDMDIVATQEFDFELK